MSQYSPSSLRHNPYLLVWGTLLVSLAAILGISAIASRAIAVPLILALAVGNAWLMFTKFMHASVEPRYVRWLIAGAAAAVLVLLVALVPDIVWK